MNALRLTLAALACSLPLMAAAQWQWVDKDGRKVFSDQPPPSDVPANRIVKQPGRAAAMAPAPVVEAAATAPKPAAPKLSGTDKELESKKKQAEAAEERKAKAEAEQLALGKADNCSRAKQAKVQFDSGVRIARHNAAGERTFLDDNERAAESQRINQIIARDCPH